MTFESTPPDYSSVNDGLIYVAYDAHAADPVTYPNYKYVAEVWVDGTKQFTGKYFPHPITNRGIMPLGDVIREYVSANLAPTGTGILAQELGEGEWSLSIVIKIREEYDGTIGAVVLADSARVFFNHYNGRYSDFTLLAPYADKPLSNRPPVINLLLSSAKYFIPYFSETTTPFDIDIAGETLTVTPTAANTLQLINIAPAAVNDDFPATIDSTTTSYTVAVGGVAYTVNIICEGLYTNYLLHFLNKFGGYETMLFNKVSKKTHEVEKKNFQQLPYRVDGSGVVSLKSGSIMHQQKTVFGGRFKEKLKVGTDHLNDAEHTWLAELVDSPEIYLEDSGTLYPVTIAATNYEFKKHIVDGLNPLTVDLEFGTSYKTQFK